MRRRLHASLQLALLLSSSACHPGFLPAREIGPGEAVQLRAGEWGRVRTTGVSFRVDSIADSRCPLNVTCIQAGAATVWLTVNGAGGALQNAALTLRAAPTGMDVDARHRLERLDVQPLPGGDGGGAKIATIAVAPGVNASP